MKPKILSPFLAVSISLCFATLHAAEVTSAANGFWTTPAIWSDATAPAAGNAYVVTAGRTVDSPEATANNGTVTFGGDSLTVQTGGILRLRHNSGGGNNTHTVNLKALTLNDGASFLTYNTSTGNVTRELTNDVTLAATGNVNFGARNDSTSGFTNALRLKGTLSGGANINISSQLQSTSAGVDRRFTYVAKANNPYTGNWSVVGTDVTDTVRRAFLVPEQPEALGTGSVTLNARSQLRIPSTGSINTLAGVTLTTATSNLEFQSVNWTNSAAFLTNNGGTVALATGDSSIGNLSGTGGTIQGNGVASALTVNQTTDATYSGTLSQTTGNVLTFTKSGPAKLTLGGASTHTGGTLVSAGTLGLIGDQSAPGLFTLSGGDLSIGTGITTLGNQTIGSLTQTSGNVVLDVSATGADHLTVTGNYQRTSGSIVARFGEQPALGTPYTLVTYGGTLSSQPPVTYVGASRITGAVDYGTGTNSAITITFSGGIADLVWTGTGGSTWDINSTQNWNNTVGGNPDKFFQFDTVTFNDNGSGGTVNLSAAVSPGAITFNNSTKAYTFTGSGSITGPATLTKSGSGTVTLATNNTNVGATTINEGTLRVGNGGTSGALGSGAVTNNGTLAFNRSDTLTFANAISGSGSLEQAGTGATILTADNSYAGTTTISAGTLQVGSGGATGSLGSGAIVNNGTLAFNRSGTVTLATDLPGTGGLTQVGPGSLILTADQTYTGATLVSGGRLQLGTGGATGAIPTTSSITTNGELAINLEGDRNFTQLITGTGSLTQAGPGTLRLTAANTYSGETRVEQGKILLDAGSDIPAGGAVAFTGGDAILDLTTKNHPIGGLRRESSTTGIGQITGSQPLTVTGGDLIIGATATATATLDLTGVPSLDYNQPSRTITVGGRSQANNANGTLRLPATATLTASAFNVQTSNSSAVGNTVDISTGTVFLGKTTTLNADQISIATSGRDNGKVGYAAVADPTLKIRATNGTGRANITMGAHGTAYGPNCSSLIDLTTGVTGTSTLDALVGNLRVGVYSRGNAQVQTTSFLMGQGTLDATSVELGNIVNNNGNVGGQVSTFTVDGGTATIATLNFGTRAQGTLTSTFNLNGGGTLAAQSITAGAGVATRNLNWNSGTLTNLAGQNLSVGGVQVKVPVTGTHTLAIASGQTATFTTGSALAFDYDSSTATAAGLTVTGSLVLDPAAALVLKDTAATVVPLAQGTKFTLINYAGGTLTGTFNGVPDGSIVLVGEQPFTINYHDASAVTLSVFTDAFPGWIDGFTALTDPLQKAKDADPDGDGLNNLAEYLLDGDPTNPLPSGKIVSKIAAFGADSAMTLTIPVLNGMVASPSDPAGGPIVLTKDGKKYTLQASADLVAWTLDVAEVTPAQASSVPLSEGYSYRTFRVVPPLATQPKAFLRVKVGE